MTREPPALDEDSITAEALAQWRLPDARHTALLQALLRHLHAYAREVDLTHAEWRQGLRFLTEAATITDDARNEFSLLSDVLGLSSLVDLLQAAPGATPGSVLGPFHVHDSRLQPNGVDLAQGQAGEPLLFHGRVLATDGRPLTAELDFWQNADNGLYPQQDPQQDPHNLRCRLHTDGEGRFAVRTVRPRPYSVPQDGPVGALMRAADRNPMRPAHLHVIVAADGFRPLTTEVFIADDPYLLTDPVFGVRPALAVRLVPCDDAREAAALGMPVPFLRCEHEFRLSPLAGGTR